MNKKHALQKIDEYFDQADTIALDLIVSEARAIMVADPDLDEFIMGMGTCNFSTTNREKGYWFSNESTHGIVDEDDDDGSGTIDKFFEMVEELNGRFQSKGCPMRFTATGNIVRNW